MEQDNLMYKKGAIGVREALKLILWLLFLIVALGAVVFLVKKVLEGVL